MQAVLGLLFASCSFVLSLNKYHGDNIWVATVDGGPDVAKKIAEKHRFEYVGQVEFDDSLYVFRKNTSKLLRKDVENFENEALVSWIEYQEPKAKSIRGVYPSMYSWMESKYRLEFNDALWYKQWYLQDYRPDVKKFVLDMNVVPCYREGITGKGVRVTVVDDGVEKDHADLRNNFDPQISFDYVMNRTDPTPPRSSASHGTQCAGVIAMVANNSLCGVGIAFNAQIGGVRLLDGGPSDLLDGQALSHRPEKVDIYSCSWGPPDDGETMEGPGRVARRAMLNGILKGRDGKGSIYVFAGGNAKMKGDNCGADGYVNSMFTIAIASAMQEGRPTFYSERCSAIMATAYSSGSIRAEQVASTGLRSTCTTEFGGTSAATPLASGVIALALQANPELTWRDVQHLIVWTSEVAPLGRNPGWIRNGKQFWVSPDFGFGLLNAHSLVTAARNFKTVPKIGVCKVKVQLLGNTTLTSRGTLDIKFATTGCKGSRSEVRFLEHVQVAALIPCSQRGALRLTLTSPSGTRSTLLEERSSDRANDGALVKNDWTMDSVHFWGEDPTGIWTFTVEVKDADDSDIGDGGYVEIFTGLIRRLRVDLYGTKEAPEHYRNTSSRPYSRSIG
ncbi:proprotein convertase subtilisin kexin type [Nesidiocoris tenuis]|uniref:Proprotein convertase subtilisin kexin type n=1 Tax=Nesidiocoris tenuis TaxID=355587 RepID=A0ABN7ATX3_9HEMI|nr:proprotein convertase subtilisin kexin type [Nesidiocoris tenuis]